MEGWVEMPPEPGSQELGEWVERLPQPVAVTGATGFIGLNLLAVLSRAGVRTRALVRNPRRLPESIRPRVEVFETDLGDPVSLRTSCHGAATVLHLAGLVRAPSEQMFDRVNRTGTANLVVALSEVAPAARLVHLSSLAATGPSPDSAGKGPQDEPAPVSAYGRSKLAGEVEARRHGGPWVILRPPAVYGPHDIDILQFFRLAARGLVPIPRGERFVTMSHVSDVVRAILAAACGSGTGRVLHLGEPVAWQLPQVVETIATAGGVRARVVGVPGWVLRAAGHCGDFLQKLGWRSVAMTSDKAAELLACHWVARSEESMRLLGLGGCVPLARGAAQTWAWYREQGWVPRAKMRGA